MKKSNNSRLLITLTTVHGSKQYNVGKLAKYALIGFGLLAAISFFVSNPLLLKTNEVLEDLAVDHENLTESYQGLMDSKQLMDELRITLGALETEQENIEKDNSRIAELNNSLDSSLSGLENLMNLVVADKINSNRASSLYAVANERLYFLHSIPNGMPIKSPKITARFGPRKHPVTKKRHNHTGIDFRAKRGTPIYATADAIVEYAGYHKKSGYGNLVILQHNFGFKTYYGHLKSVQVKNYTFVRKGELIGYSGNTGVSTGPHLHYEVRHMFRPLDPDPFLAWNISDFDFIFTKVKGVKWASLQKMYPLSLKDKQEPQSSQKETNLAVK